jgi:hypothetical protein
MEARELEKHFAIMTRFVEVYCRDHHGAADGAPCDECRDLLGYARRKLERCPYDPKPACKDCETHCYKREYRDRVREIMRYSGIYFVKRGRLDWLVKYFLLEGLPKRRSRRGSSRRATSKDGTS